MNKYKQVFLLALVSVIVACVAQPKQSSQSIETNQAVASSSVKNADAEVEAQIERIKEKLATKPTVKGWVLVGDGLMHLARYEEAIQAYQEAHVLSDFKDAESKKKMKKAIFNYLQNSRSSGTKPSATE